MSGATAKALDKRYYGVVEALVEEVEGDPEGEGRVKIKFPWFDEDTVTEWCRVRQLYAGNGYGAFFLPEKGNEVLVSFIHGDMRKPIILGGLYNGQDKPPTKRTKQDDHKLLQTKYGHQIDLNDSDGKQHIDVKTKKGHELKLSDEKDVVTLTTSNGMKAELDQTANTINITTAGGDKVQIDGNGGKVTVSSKTVVIEGNSVKLGGEGAAQSVLLGDIFVNLFNSHFHGTSIAGPTTPPTVPLISSAVLSMTTKTS
jgi:phage baseplate assembly protein V